MTQIEIFYKMGQEVKDNQDFSLGFILAVIFGVLTAWVVTESIAWAFVGALLGLLTAGLYINVVIKGSRND